MLWNLMMHGLMGWLGAWYFLPTVERIGIAVLAVCMTQAVDQARIRKEKMAEIDSLLEAGRGEMAKGLEQRLGRVLAVTYLQNVALYTIVLLLMAHAARLNGWI